MYVCMKAWMGEWKEGRMDGWKYKVGGSGHVRRPESSGMALRGERRSPAYRPARDDRPQSSPIGMPPASKK
jgi:hypothetical protein